jgi:hypothetical protein
MGRRNVAPWLLGGGLLVALLATLPRPERRVLSRDGVVRLALSEVGKSDPLPYWAEVSGPEGHPNTSWCAAFVLWVLRKAGLTDWTYDQAGAWFYRLPRTEDPQPGDLIFFTDNRHLAMITASSPTTLELVDGAGTAGRVSRRTLARPISASAEMFTIAPLLEAA